MPIIGTISTKNITRSKGGKNYERKYYNDDNGSYDDRFDEH